jgi:predicted outer membrane protein
MSPRAAIFCLLAGLAFAGPATALPDRDAINALRDAASGTFGKFTAEITTHTRAFVAATTIKDLYVTEAAEVAKRRSISPRVRSFANSLAADAEASGAELKRVLHSYNVDAAPVPKLDFRRRSMISELMNTPMRDFDRRYLAQQILADSEQRILLRRYVGGGKIIAIRQYAARRLGKIDEQLSGLQRLRREF